MNKYITNIEQSKKLKEIGVPQKSFFGWNSEGNALAGNYQLYSWADHAVAAFTIQELIEILGDQFFEICDCRDFAVRRGNFIAISFSNKEAYGSTIIEALYFLILLLFARGELIFKN